MAKLSVNINKLATLRNARGGFEPNLCSWVKKIQEYGAHGITVHPRPDERHIKRSDVYEIKPLVSTEFNIEGYPSTDFINLILETQPEQCTLVPDGPDVLTSNAGWNLKSQAKILEETLPKLSPHTRVSVFMEPQTTTPEAAKTLKSLGAQRAELYTEDFSKNFLDSSVLASYRQASDTLLNAGLELNAGHDLNLENLPHLLKAIPEIKEVSIGHALICEALDLGMQETLKRYLKILNG